MKNRTHELSLISRMFISKEATNYEIHKSIKDIYTVYYGFIFYSKSLNIAYREYIKSLYDKELRGN